ncbi:hypothetical protein OG252_33225 [Streptomyces sp. NBC_01352]|uniref:hypothetical protein n=1 Tax=Streptomyces sp. NBC_01352 TaxID=2903834 RepID=UPI002E32C776|nr:hypothetical protein [Streptomyces sp. NBC_01352]
MPGTPTVLRWPLAQGAFPCPTCGTTEGVTVALDAEDASPDPSYMRCGNGHFWEEPAFPRLIGAGMLRGALREDPGFVAMAQRLCAALDRPRVTGMVHLPDGARGRGGAPIACPRCRARKGLAVGFDSHVFDREPSTMRCLNGHQWDEERFPRWVAANLSHTATDLDSD